MADVKWIKLTTDMFDNRKIKYLRKLPEGNNIVLIWVMLLTMAGRCNASGMIFLTENIPYTTKMLADELDFEENTVILALEALTRMNMIVSDGNVLTIAGWGEHQNIEGMDKIREQNRLRKAAQREREKLLLEECHVTSRDGHALDKDKIRKEEDKKENRDIRHKYGTYSNVLLSDKQMEKLKAEFPTDWEERIERVSEYCASTGKSYKDFLATIRSWARKDIKEEKKTNKQAFRGSQDMSDVYGDELIL